MNVVKKNVKGFIIKSVIRDEADRTKNNELDDIFTSKKPRSDKSAKEVVIETLGIEPDFINAVMITDIQPITKTYEMSLANFMANATEVTNENAD